MDAELPDDFDIIVVGTGLTESIVSGALSRIGKKVLHLDHLKNYGSDWSSFNLKAFEKRMQESNGHAEDFTIDGLQQKVDDGTEFFIPIKNVRQTVYDGVTKCYIEDPEVPAPPPEGDDRNPVVDNITEKVSNESLPKEISPVNSMPSHDDAHDGQSASTAQQQQDVKMVDNSDIKNKDEKQKEDSFERGSKERFYSKWRHFNLDLSPKLMFSRGKLVELLIASNVCRYLEFRNVTGTLTLMEEPETKLVPVPCSRTDIFNSKLVTMVEKRLLMRILTTCANYESRPEEYKDYEDRPFIEFLASKKLSKKLQHFIIHSIAMVSEDAKTLDGLKASEKFLKSLGRYGNSAFLWTTYGVGELPQAFCRLGAVFGGTFCLNRYPLGIIISKAENRCIGIIDSTGQRLKCNHLILNECYVPNSCRKELSNKISRAIYVTDTPFAEGGNACLISIPPTSEIPPARLIEVSPGCGVCPHDMHVVHAMMEKTDDFVPSCFSKLEEVLFAGYGYPITNSDLSTEGEGSNICNMKQDRKKPNVLWSSYFRMASDGVDPSTLPENVLSTKGPYYELGFDTTIVEARALFESICPNEEFLPRAPNPEEIIYFDQNDEGYNTENNGAENNTPDENSGEYQEDNEMELETAETPAATDDDV